MTDQTEDGLTATTPPRCEFMSAERLIFFSDAVVAIAITLLALGLPVPQSQPAVHERSGLQAMWMTTTTTWPS